MIIYAIYVHVTLSFVAAAAVAASCDVAAVLRMREPRSNIAINSLVCQLVVQHFLVIVAVVIVYLLLNSHFVASQNSQETNCQNKQMNESTSTTEFCTYFRHTKRRELASK